MTGWCMNRPNTQTAAGVLHCIGQEARVALRGIQGSQAYIARTNPIYCAWQGASWSSMEFGGKWRLVHYTMKAAYAPFLISAQYNKATGTVEVWGTSDMTHPVSGTHT